MSGEALARAGSFREARAPAAPRAPRSRTRGPARARARAPLLTDAEMERYSRQLVLPEWTEMAQLALRDASVLVIGAGALGSPVALYLAGRASGGSGSPTTTTSSSPTCTASPCTSPPTSGWRRSSRPPPSCAS